MHRHLLGGVLAAWLCLGSCGCSSLGASQLDHDQVDYARALGLANKRQTLMGIVSLRYADAPAFLTVSQVIAAYTFDTSGGATLAAGTPSVTGRSATINGTIAYSNHPTFTFTPTTGEEFAATYIRPLPAALVLPLAQSGQPIDLIFRLAIQSVGSLHNSAALGGSGASGSLGFFELIHALRRLQLAGDLAITISKGNDGEQIELQLGGSPQPAESVRSDEMLARKLLGVARGVNKIELVSGAVSRQAGQVSIATRSMLAILSEVGAQAEVPDSDVKANMTLPTIQVIPPETRPVIIIHVGPSAPADAFVSIAYGGSEHWIENSDFDSKFAFSLVQDLVALAEASQQAKPPTVTIPAG